MVDETEKKTEEVVVMRRSDESSLGKPSADLLSAIMDTATLPHDPDKLIDEATARMRRVQAIRGLNRSEKNMAIENLSKLIAKAYSAMIEKDTEYAENLIYAKHNIRQVRLAGAYLQFLRGEGAKIIDSINNFVRGWLEYSQKQEEETKGTDLTPERKQLSLEIIKENESCMINDMKEGLNRFRQRNKAKQLKLENTLDQE